MPTRLGDRGGARIRAPHGVNAGLLGLTPETRAPRGWWCRSSAAGSRRGSPRCAWRGRAARRSGVGGALRHQAEHLELAAGHAEGGQPRGYGGPAAAAPGRRAGTAQQVAGRAGGRLLAVRLVLGQAGAQQRHRVAPALGDRALERDEAQRSAQPGQRRQLFLGRGDQRSRLQGPPRPGPPRPPRRRPGRPGWPGGSAACSPRRVSRASVPRSSTTVRSRAQRPNWCSGAAERCRASGVIASSSVAQAPLRSWAARAANARAEAGMKCARARRRSSSSRRGGARARRVARPRPVPGQACSARPARPPDGAQRCAALDEILRQVPGCRRAADQQQVLPQHHVESGDLAEQPYVGRDRPGLLERRGRLGLERLEAAQSQQRLHPPRGEAVLGRELRGEAEAGGGGGQVAEPGHPGLDHQGLAPVARRAVPFGERHGIRCVRGGLLDVPGTVRRVREQGGRARIVGPARALDVRRGLVPAAREHRRPGQAERELGVQVTGGLVEQRRPPTPSASSARPAADSGSTRSAARATGVAPADSARSSRSAAVRRAPRARSRRATSSSSAAASCRAPASVSRVAAADTSSSGRPRASSASAARLARTARSGGSTVASTASRVSACRHCSVSSRETSRCAWPALAGRRGRRPLPRR